MQKKLLLSVLATAFLISGAVLVWKQQENQASKEVKNEEVKTDTISADTSDWKTYRNEKYGYSIKYPSDWFVDSRFSEQAFSKRGLPESSEYIGGDTIVSNYQTRDFTLDTIPEDLRTVSLLIYRIDPVMQYKDFKYGHVPRTEEVKEVTIDGQSAYKIEGVNTDHPVGVVSKTTLIKRDDKMFVFTYSKKTGFSEADEEIAENIVNSFQDIE